MEKKSTPNSIPYIIKIDPGMANIKKKKSFFSKKPLFSLYDDLYESTRKYRALYTCG